MRASTTARALVTVLIALASGSPSDVRGQVQDGTVPGELHGVVLDGRDPTRPAQGARVELDGGVRTASTSEGGAFVFGELPSGTYLLRASAPGYRPTERLIEHPAGEGLEIVLVPRLFRLDEVVASASPLSGRAAYQPSVAVDREGISTRMGASLASVIDGEPGIRQRSYGAAPARPVIRGFDGDRVLVLENGERMGDLSETAADHAVALDPMAASRVEVVRGPASLLYGSGALGGIVNVITDDIPAGAAAGLGGGWESQLTSARRSVTTAGHLTHGGERWAGTGRMTVVRSDDLRTPLGPLPGTDLSSMDGSVGFGFQGDRSSGGVSVAALDRRYGIPESLDDPDEEVEIEMARQRIQGRLDWSGTGAITGGELRVAASRLHQDEWERTHLASGGREDDLELAYRQAQAGATLTLRHRGAGRLDGGAVGVQARSRNLRVGGIEAFTPGARERSAAIFTFQELALGPGLRLQAGARVERQGLEARASARFPDPGPGRHSTALSGSIGVQAAPAEGLEVGVQVARAHRHPLLEELYADGPHLAAGVFEVGDRSLEDETATGLDGFVRWRTDRSSLEVAGFVSRIDDFVAFAPQGTVDPGSDLPVYRYEGTRARMLGGEVTAELLLTDALRLEAVADYVRGSRRGEESLPLPAIPPARAKVSLEREWLRGWVGGSLEAVAAQRRVAPDERPTGGYRLVGFHAGARLDSEGRHLLVLRLDNATDRAYRDHLSRVRERDRPMPGRDLSLGYRWRF